MSKYKALAFTSCIMVACLLVWFWQSENKEHIAARSAQQELSGAPANTASSSNNQTPILSDVSSENSKQPVENDFSRATPALSPIERIRSIQEKTDFQSALVKEHDTFTRYPGYNKSITDSSKDPVATRYEVYPRETQAEDGKASLTIWSDKKFYLPGETSVVRAQLKDQNGAPVRTDFAGQLIFNERENLGPVEFTQDNSTALAKITLDAETFQAGIYKVLVVNAENELADGITFTLSKPNISLTGEYRDSLTNERHLIIEVNVNVSQAGRFYAEGSLYSATNDPIGTSQYSGELEEGRHWIPLQYQGLMIRDAQEPGPYLLKNLSLAKVTIPMQLAPLEQTGFYTQKYTLDQFNNQRFSDSDSLANR